MTPFSFGLIMIMMMTVTMTVMMMVMMMTIMTTYLQVLHQYDALLLWFGHENTAATEEAVLEQATVNILILHMKEGLVTCTKTIMTTLTDILNNNMITTVSKNKKWELHIHQILSVFTTFNLVVTGSVVDDRHHLKQSLLLGRLHKLQQLGEGAAVPERLLEEKESPEKN